MLFTEITIASSRHISMTSETVSFNFSFSYSSSCGSSARGVVVEFEDFCRFRQHEHKADDLRGTFSVRGMDSPWVGGIYTFGSSSWTRWPLPVDPYTWTRPELYASQPDHNICDACIHCSTSSGTPGHSHTCSTLRWIAVHLQYFIRHTWHTHTCSTSGGIPVHLQYFIRYIGTLSHTCSTLRGIAVHLQYFIRHTWTLSHTCSTSGGIAVHLQYFIRYIGTLSHTCSTLRGIAVYLQYFIRYIGTLSHTCSTLRGIAVHLQYFIRHTWTLSDTWSTSRGIAVHLQYFIEYSSMLWHLPFTIRRARSRHVLLHSLPPRPPPDYA